MGIIFLDTILQGNNEKAFFKNGGNVCVCELCPLRPMGCFI